jgi:hypothetical protein
MARDIGKERGRITVGHPLPIEVEEGNAIERVKGLCELTEVSGEIRMDAAFEGEAVEDAGWDQLNELRKGKNSERAEDTAESEEADCARVEEVAGKS